jgi:Tol biopolymer transport system component
MNLLRKSAAVVVLVLVIIPAGDGGATSSRPLFPGRNGKIAFAGTQPNTNPQIEVVKPNGSGLRALTRPGEDCVSVRCGGHDPAWSPDGEKLAFVKTYSSGGIWVVDGNGGGARNIYSAGDDVDWSPDGESLVFGDLLAGVFVIRVGGRHATKIADAGDKLIFATAWSPSGATIAFAKGDLANTNVCGVESDIYTVKPDGSGLMLLTSGGANLSPAWSPDGLRLAFLHVEGSRVDIKMMNADGSNLQAVIQTHPGICDDNYLGLAWSPDGREFAYVDGRRYLWIFVVNIDGKGRHRVTPGSGDLSWQPLHEQQASTVTSLLPT